MIFAMNTRGIAPRIAGVIGIVAAAGGISVAALASTTPPPNPKSLLPANTNHAAHKDPNDPRRPVPKRPLTVLSKRQMIARAKAAEAADPGHVVVCFTADGSVATLAHVALAPGTTLTAAAKQATCDQGASDLHMKGLHP